jgi:hypothetical protein
MTHEILNISKIALGDMKSDLELQESFLNMDLDTILQKEGDITAEHANDTDYDPDSDVNLKNLQYQQQMYDNQKGSIEGQLKEINAAIDGYGKALDKNTPADCTLNISGGH